MDLFDASSLPDDDPTDTLPKDYETRRTETNVKQPLSDAYQTLENEANILRNNLIAECPRLQDAKDLIYLDKMERQAFTSSNRQTLVISEKLSLAEMALLDSTFPFIQLEYSKTVNNQHAFAAAHRRCEMHVLFNKLRYNVDVDYSTSLKDYGYDVYIVDIGANFTDNIKHNRHYVHSCSPVLDSNDANRYTNRFSDIMVTMINTKMASTISRDAVRDVRSLSQVNKHTKTVCLMSVDKCPTTAPFGIALHSLYDIDFRTLGKAMINKNMLTVHGCMVFCEGIFRQKEGTVSNLKMNWRVHNGKITFGFDSDSSYMYTHDLKQYLKWFTVPSFTIDGYEFYIELQENLNGVQFLRVNKQILRPQSNTVLRTRMYNDEAVDKLQIYFEFSDPDMMAQLYTQSVDFVVNSSRDHKDFPQSSSLMTSFDTNLVRRNGVHVESRQLKDRHLYCVRFLLKAEWVMKGVCFAMRVTEAKFKPVEVFSMLVSWSSRVMVGKDFIRSYEADPVQLFIAAYAIYVFVYDLKYKVGRGLQTILKQIDNDRSLSNLGLLNMLKAYCTTPSVWSKYVPGVKSMNKIYNYVAGSLYKSLKYGVTPSEFITAPMRYRSFRGYLWTRGRNQEISISIPPTFDETYGKSMADIVKQIFEDQYGGKFKSFDQECHNDADMFVLEPDRDKPVVTLGVTINPLDKKKCYFDDDPEVWSKIQLADKVQEARFQELVRVVRKSQGSVVYYHYHDDGFLTKQVMLNILKDQGCYYDELRHNGKTYWRIRSIGKLEKYSVALRTLQDQNVDDARLFCDELSLGDYPRDVLTVRCMKNTACSGQPLRSGYSVAESLMPLIHQLDTIPLKIQRQATESLYPKVETELGYVIRNNSAQKLHELINGGLENLICGRSYLDLCCNPGGWAAYLKGRNRTALYYTVSLKGFPGALEPEYLGDLDVEDLTSDKQTFSLTNFRDLSGLCRKSLGVDYVLADGAVDLCNNYGQEEVVNMPLIIAEATAAVWNLQPQGSFLLKTFGFETAMGKTLLAILACTFQSLRFFKPPSSKLKNFELYLYCSNLVPERRLWAVTQISQLSLTSEFWQWRGQAYAKVLQRLENYMREFRENQYIGLRSYVNACRNLQTKVPVTRPLAPPPSPPKEFGSVYIDVSKVQKPTVSTSSIVQPIVVDPMAECSFSNSRKEILEVVDLQKRTIFENWLVWGSKSLSQYVFHQRFTRGDGSCLFWALQSNYMVGSDVRAVMNRCINTQSHEVLRDELNGLNCGGVDSVGSYATLLQRQVRLMDSRDKVVMIFGESYKQVTTILFTPPFQSEGVGHYSHVSVSCRSCRYVEPQVDAVPVLRRLCFDDMQLLQGNNGVYYYEIFSDGCYRCCRLQALQELSRGMYLYIPKDMPLPEGTRERYDVLIYDNLEFFTPKLSLDCLKLKSLDSLRSTSVVGGKCEEFVQTAPLKPSSESCLTDQNQCVNEIVLNRALTSDSREFYKFCYAEHSQELQAVHESVKLDVPNFVVDLVRIPSEPRIKITEVVDDLCDSHQVLKTELKLQTSKTVENLVSKPVVDLKPQVSLVSEERLMTSEKLVRMKDLPTNHSSVTLGIVDSNHSALDKVGSQLAPYTCLGASKLFVVDHRGVVLSSFPNLRSSTLVLHDSFRGFIGCLQALACGLNENYVRSYLAEHCQALHKLLLSNLNGENRYVLPLIAIQLNLRLVVYEMKTKKFFICNKASKVNVVVAVQDLERKISLSDFLCATEVCSVCSIGFSLVNSVNDPTSDLSPHGRFRLGLGESVNCFQVRCYGRCSQCQLNHDAVENAKNRLHIHNNVDVFSVMPGVPFVHCISEDCHMTKGIALTCVQKFGGQSLRDKIKSLSCRVGQVASVKVDDQIIINLITKFRYFQKPTYSSVDSCLVSLAAKLQAEGITEIKMPRIACGLDGCDWKLVSQKILKLLCSKGIIVHVFVFDEKSLARQQTEVLNSSDTKKHVVSKFQTSDSSTRKTPVKQSLKLANNKSKHSNGLQTQKRDLVEEPKSTVMIGPVAPPPTLVSKEKYTNIVDSRNFLSSETASVTLPQTFVPPVENACSLLKCDGEIISTFPSSKSLVYVSVSEGFVDQFLPLLFRCTLDYQCLSDLDNTLFQRESTYLTLPYPHDSLLSLSKDYKLTFKTIDFDTGDERVYGQGTCGVTLATCVFKGKRLFCHCYKLCSSCKPFKFQTVPYSVLADKYRLTLSGVVIGRNSRVVYQLTGFDCASCSLKALVGGQSNKDLILIPPLNFPYDDMNCRVEVYHDARGRFYENRIIRGDYRTSKKELGKRNRTVYDHIMNCMICSKVVAGCETRYDEANGYGSDCPALVPNPIVESNLMSRYVPNDSVLEVKFLVAVGNRGEVIRETSSSISLNVRTKLDGSTIEQIALVRYGLREKLEQQGLRRHDKVSIVYPANLDIVPVIDGLFDLQRLVYVPSTYCKEYKPVLVKPKDLKQHLANSMKEIRYVWYQTFDGAGREMRSVYSRAVQAAMSGIPDVGVSKDTTFGLIDVASCTWAIKGKGLKPSYSRAYYADGDKDVFLDIEGCITNTHIVPKRLQEVTRGKNIRFLALNKLTVYMNEEALYESVKGVPIFQNTLNFNINYVEGAPGAGKTHYILQQLDQRMTFDSIVATATREAASDLRLRSGFVGELGSSRNNKAFLNKKFRTLDSLTMHLDDYTPGQVKRLFVDEASMRHEGQIFWVAQILKVQQLIICGDRAQIAYFNNDGYKTLYHRMPECFKKNLENHYLTVTKRCPADVCAVLNDMSVEGKKLYPNKLTTLNHKLRSMQAIFSPTAHNVDFTDAQVLTFTNLEKNSVKEMTDRPVNTIAEFQGKQCKHVVLVRTQAKLLEIYKDYSQFVVAISRHTESFTYVTAARDDLYDLVRHSFNKTESDLRKCLEKLQGGGYVFNSFRGNDDRYFPKLDVFEQKPDFDVLLKPSYVKDLAGEPRVMTDLVLNHGGTGYSQCKPLFKQIHDVDVVHVEHPPVETYSPIPVLQDFVDDIMPTSGGEFNQFDIDVFEMGDFHVNAYDFTISDESRSYVKKDTMHSSLRTPCAAHFDPSQRQIMKAFNERNGGVPELAGRIPDVVLVEQLIGQFIDAYVGDVQLLQTYKQDLIEPNTESLTEWIETQAPMVLKVLEADPDHDILQKQMGNYYYMLKNMAKPVLDPDPLTKNPSPQAIAFQDKKINAIFSPVIKDMKQRLYSVLRRDKIVASDLSVEGFEAILNTRFPPYLLDKYKYWKETDFGKFDKSQGLLALMVDIGLMELFGVPKNLRLLWLVMHVETELTSVSQRFKAYVQYQRKSGDAYTFLGNTLFLMVVLAHLIGPSIRDAFCLFAGDDSFLFLLEPVDTSDLTKTCAAVFNLEVKILTYNVPYFCSKFLIPVDDLTWEVVPDLWKTVIKLGRNDLVNETHCSEYRISLLDNLKTYKNTFHHELYALAVADRYKMRYLPIHACASLYSLVENETHFKHLYFVPDGFILSQRTTGLPSFDI